jgi:hypothetical protein
MNNTRKVLDYIIHEKARGNTFQELNIQMKIMMKGVNVKAILNDTLDDPEVEKKLKEIAKEFAIDLNKMSPA